MRVLRIGRAAISAFAALVVAPALSGCFLIGLSSPPCPDNRFESDPNNWCTCQANQASIPKHVCCRGPGCDEDSENPDSETSDPVGTLSLVLNDLRIEPLEPLTEVCDGGEKSVHVKWEYVNLTNGTLADSSQYLTESPLLMVDRSDIVQGGNVHNSSAGWSSIAAQAFEPHDVSVGVGPGDYVGYILGLPIVGVQNAQAVANKSIYNLQAGDPRYNSKCGTGGSGG